LGSSVFYLAGNILRLHYKVTDDDN